METLFGNQNQVEKPFLVKENLLTRTGKKKDTEGKDKFEKNYKTSNIVSHSIENL